MRYQEWWYSIFPVEFRKRGYDVHVLGEKYLQKARKFKSGVGMFSPISEAIKFEAEQIKEYSEMSYNINDVLFLADTSFPGIFGNVLFHGRPRKVFGFCHATSLNMHDYFEIDKEYKYPIEDTLMRMMNTVFVGSEYHQTKLLSLSNTKVTYLPFQPRNNDLEVFTKKKHLFMSASRPGTQKVNMQFEFMVENLFDTTIYRPTSNSWEEYFENLRMSQFLLISSHEDTFGYQIVDAVTNNCIPLAPKKCAYPELLPREYLYTSFDDFVLRYSCLTAEGKPEVPKLLCNEQMHAFFDVICEEMKEINN
jgi:hypothetical protein